MSPRKRAAQSSDEDDEDNALEPATPKAARRKNKQVRLNVAEEQQQHGGGARIDATRVVTPHQPKQGADPQQAASSSSPPVCQKQLFAEDVLTGTPSKTQQQQQTDDANSSQKPKAVSPVKRKLIFGRSVVEVEVKNSVRQIYNIVRKLTGSIGGNGSFGPIYGELTMGSMQKMINLMKEHTGFDSSSRFIDVGSGIGKPNLHVAQDPGVEFSFGIEVEADRWLLGMNCLKGVLDAAQEQQAQQPRKEDTDDKILHNCIFMHGDITNAQSFDSFTHVYMFSIGFPPSLWCELSDMWNRSSSPYLICYHGPRDIIHSYEFNVELVVQTPTSMHGSKEGHMGYIYRRSTTTTPSATAEVEPTIGSKTVTYDPYFAPAYEQVQSGFSSLKDHVDSMVEEKMESGTSTRSSRKAKRR